MRKTIKQLERELEYARKFEDLYREEKRKYEDEFKKEYQFIMDNQKRLFDSNYQLLEIIRWQINPETAKRIDPDFRPYKPLSHD